MDDPWYADPTICETSKVEEAESKPRQPTANLPGPNDVEHRKRVAHISKLPSGKNRVEQVLSYVHDTDPRAYNDFLMELTIEEQDELTQGLLKIRKKKKADKNSKSGQDITKIWYLKIPEEERSAGSIIVWWETRRVVYNAIVGAVGLLSIAIMLLSNGRLNPHELVSMLLFGTITYGVAANICYTGGWMAELAAHRLFREKAEFFGPIALLLGTSFSVAITLAPAAVLMLIWLMRFFGMG